MHQLEALWCLSQAEKEKNQGKNNGEEKGQEKGTDQPRGSSQVSVTSQPWWSVWLSTGHTGRAAGPGQHSRQPGWAAERGLPGAVLWGPCRQRVPSTLLRAPREEQTLGWLQGDAESARKGWAHPCLQRGRVGPWLREVQQPVLTPDCCYSCLPGQKSTEVQAVLHSIYCSKLHYLKKRSKVKCWLQSGLYKAEPVAQTGRLHV